MLTRLSDLNAKEFMSFISFRSPIQSQTTDVLNDIGIDCLNTIDFVVEAISLLASYSEEGTVLKPTIYIFNSLNLFKKRSGLIHQSVLLRSTNLKDNAKNIIKSCAPLARDNWHIFIERSEDGTCNAGVMFETFDFTQLSFDESIAGDSEEFPVLKIEPVSNNHVRLITNKNHRTDFHFNSRKNSNDDEIRNIALISNAFAHDVEPDSGLRFAEYANRLLFHCLKQCHGTIIAVIKYEAEVPNIMKDCILLEDPVDVYLHYKGILSGTDSIENTAAITSLLSGFVDSDGFTMLDSRGRILGFRGFAQVNGVNGTFGGARSRAYAAMKEEIGETLLATFFRSQDGRTMAQSHLDLE